MMRFSKLFLLATLLVVVGALEASACPMCVEALQHGPGGSKGALPRAFYYSILFMLSMPFLVTGAFCVYFYRLQQGQPAYQVPGDDAPAQIST